MLVNSSTRILNGCTFRRKGIIVKCKVLRQRTRPSVVQNAPWIDLWSCKVLRKRTRELRLARVFESAQSIVFFEGGGVMRLGL